MVYVHSFMNVPFYLSHIIHHANVADMCLRGYGQQQLGVGGDIRSDGNPQSLQMFVTGIAKVCW